LAGILCLTEGHPQPEIASNRRTVTYAMKRFRTFAVAVISTMLAVSLLAGCSGQPPTQTSPSPEVGPRPPLSQIALLSNPKDHLGASTALLASATISPIQSNPVQMLPANVTSRDLAGDVPITISSTKRIIGLDLSGSIAATIFGLGLGDSVVGRDVATTFAAARSLPVVTSGAISVNSETLLALRPSLVITDGSIGPIDSLLQLRDAGIAVVFVKKVPSLEGVSALVRDVAAVLGVVPAGEALAAKLSGDIAAKVAEIAAIAPTSTAKKVRMLFLYLRGDSGIYYLFGKESGADVLIDALGGIDVASEIGWSGMKPMTDEALVAADPDLILVMTDGLASVGGITGLLQSKPALGLTAAGKHKRFVDMADGEVLSFGPRTADVLDALARAIYGK
jgi:iron complex transport system substrate-binding protein